MHATESGLRQDYSNRETEELVVLAARGGLTGLAERVLRGELERRGVSPEVILAGKKKYAELNDRPDEDPRIGIWTRLVAAAVAAVPFAIIGVLLGLTVFRPPILVLTKFGHPWMFGAPFLYIAVCAVAGGLIGAPIGYWAPRATLAILFVVS